MKKLLLSLFAFSVSIWSYSQPAADTIMFKGLLFEHFIFGKVLLKSGKFEEAAFNYDTRDQSILFFKNGDYLILTSLETIDTIYIRGRKFVPANTIFYEVVAASGKVNLYVTYSNTIKPATAATVHTGISGEPGARLSNTATNVYVTRPHKGDQIIEIQKRFWIGDGKTLVKINNEKQVVQFFPSREESIHQFVKENHLDFSSEEDLKKLLDHCSR